MSETYSPYDQAILLLAFLTEKGVLVFPSQNPQFPGLHWGVEPRKSIFDQIQERVRQQYPDAQFHLNLEWDSSFVDAVPMGEQWASLYIARVHPLGENVLPRYLHTFPYLLQTMSKDRSRLPYLRAWQVLMGAHKQEIRVLENS